MMIIITIMTIILIVCSTSDDFIQKYTSSLSYGNFSSIVNSNNYDPVVVMFYSPSCTYSKEFLPIFEEVSQSFNELSNNAVQFYSVDCTIDGNKDLYWQQNINKYPTIKLYLHNKPIEYKDELKFPNFVEFLRENTRNALVSLDKGLDDLISFRDYYLTPVSPIVILFIPQHLRNDYSMYYKFDYVCKLNKNICALTSSDTVAVEYNLNHENYEILILRQFDSESSIVTASSKGFSIDATSDEILLANWIKLYSFPLVTLLSNENKDSIFNEERPGYQIHIALVIDTSREESFVKSLTTLFELIAAKYRGKCVFILINSSSTEPLIQQTLTDINVINSNSEVQVVIIHSRKDSIHLYKFNEDDEINENSLTFWIQQFFSNNLKPSFIQKEIELEN